MMAVHPLSAVPQLESLPGAPATVYLDFNGHTFNGLWHKNTEKNKSYYPGFTPAYDTSGNAGSFTDQELSQIRRIWTFVAERFSPFNLNVSTKAAPATLVNKKHMVIAVGGTGAWYGGQAMGVALLGSFYTTRPNVGFAFTKHPQFSGDDQVEMGHVIAHEAAHGFGLEHQSEWDGNTLVDEYGDGTSAQSPIMGNNADADRITWWKGPTDEGPNAIQDDIALLASPANGFGYRPDDHGNTSASAAPLTAGAEGMKVRRGVIEKWTDKDWFKFNGGEAETVSIRVRRPAERGMLNADLWVGRPNGTLLGAKFTDAPDETIKLTNLPKGTDYRVMVRSHLNGTDVGQYQVEVMAADIAGAPDVYRGFKAAFAVQNFGPTASYRWDLDGDGVFGETGSFAARGSENGRMVMFDAANVNAGTYPVKVKVFRPDGMETLASTTVKVKRPVVTVSATDPNAGEGYAKGYNGQHLTGGMLRVSRTGPTAYPLTVTLGISGTAVKGIDYHANKIGVGGAVTIPANKSFVDVPVSVVNDQSVEPQEVALFKLLGGGNAYEAGNPKEAGIVIKDDDLPAPTNLAAVARFVNRINLSWKDNSYNETFWVLRRSTSSSFSTYQDTYIYGANVTTTSSLSLQPGTTYYYKLRAANDQGGSLWSSVLTVSTKTA